MPLEHELSFIYQLQNKMINAIVIDDEPIALQALQVAIDRYCPEVHIKGAYQSPEEGLEAIRKAIPRYVREHVHFLVS